MNNYTTTKDAFLGRAITSKQMVLTSREVADGFRILIRAHEFMDKKVCDLLARIRVQTRDDKPLALIRYYRKRSSKDILESDVNLELEKLQSEMESVRVERRKRIDFLFGEDDT